MADSIQQIQFKRGRKAVLEAVLTKEKKSVLLIGEPAYETDTGQLKIGNGISDYKDLAYISGGSGGIGIDSRFEITDPVNNQVLVYDQAKNKWVNKTTIFEHASDELINGNVYHILWKVKPTALNTVYGITTDPSDGSSIEVCSDKGVISITKVAQETSAISTADINNLF